MIYFGFFAFLLVLMTRYPAAAAGALLSTWALDQWARSQDSFFVIHMGLTNWITSLLLLVALVLRMVKGKPLWRPFTREYGAMLAIYAMAMLSWVWSVSPEDTLGQWQAMYRVVVIFGLLMPLAISDVQDLKATLYTMLIVGFAICLLVLTTGQFRGREMLFNTAGVFTVAGLESGNPLAIATIAAHVAVLGMLMNFRGTARIWQVARYAVVGVAFALSVKSGSRGQSVSMLFCVLCFLPFSRRFRDLRSFAAVATSLVLFGAVTLYLLSVMASEAQSGERWSWNTFVDDYTGGRVNTSLDLLQAWATSNPIHWLIGLGSSASFKSDIIGMYPHVVFAEVLGELGVVGWLILWLFPIFTYQNLTELWHYVKDDPEDRGLIATLGALALFEIMMSFKQGSLLGSAICFAFIIMLGRITATYRQKYAEYAALDAGMYAMSPADWDDVDGPYDEAVAGGAVAARGH